MKKIISFLLLGSVFPTTLFSAAFSDIELSFYRDSISTLSTE